MTLVSRDSGAEYSQTHENLSFTFPSMISYVVKADGSLIGPDKSVSYIQNTSSFPIHASSVGITETGSWKFVENIDDAGTTANSVKLVFGPDAKQGGDNSINAAMFMQKTADTDNMPLKRHMHGIWHLWAKSASTLSEALPT